MIRRIITKILGNFTVSPLGENEVGRVIADLQQWQATALREGFSGLSIYLRPPQEHAPNYYLTACRDETDEEMSTRLEQERREEEKREEQQRWQKLGQAATKASAALATIESGAAFLTKEEVLAAWEKGQKKGNKP